ncbi:hypothetical protein LCGC14_1106790 [marine sediment metagenome]|uniref:Uncharacterized protein n=1 Tax=marine sediment metagenome TaxID=412755 RepID=A0A0F9QE54_9ZZZZ
MTSSGFHTHLPVLQKILEEKKPKIIVEDGGGEHSTRLFIESDTKTITTIEEDEAWFEKLKAQFPYDSQDKWLILRRWSDSLFDVVPDLVFIDGKKETRCERANEAFRAKVPIVVIHDTEFKEFYSLDKLHSLGYTEEVHVDKDSAFKGTPGRQKQTSVFTLQKYKIHLKLYGLPRTYTNWVAYNIMKTWPEVKVWHNNGPSSPNAEAFWKHGEFRVVKGIDGYIHVCKNLKAWKSSMDRYLPLGLIELDERFLNFVWRGWVNRSQVFEVITSSKHYFFNPESENIGDLKKSMQGLFLEIGAEFDLPMVPFHYETKRMWRSGDAYPLDHYLTDEDYET